MILFKNRISIKLFIFIILIGLVPFIVFSLYSVDQAKSFARDNIISSNFKISQQLAGRIVQYFRNVEDIIQSIAENFSQNNVPHELKSTILRNHAISFPEFHYFHLVNLDGSVALVSQTTLPHMSYSEDPFFIKALTNTRLHTGVFMNKDMIPAMRFYVPISLQGKLSQILVAEADLLHLWKLVEELKVGKDGFVSLTTPEQLIFASGNGKFKQRAIALAPLPDDYLSLGSAFWKIQKEFEQEYLLTWTILKEDPFFKVLVYQPLSEAYELSQRIINKLIIFSLIFIFTVLILSWYLGRHYVVNPLQKLSQHLKVISSGNLRERVHIKGDNEFGDLAKTLNEMSQSILDREQELVQKETQAALGRMAKGLAHDIKHPFSTIEMYTNALEEQHDDEEFRRQFIKMVKNQFENIHVFLDNLSSLSKDISFNPSLINLSDFLLDYIKKVEVQTRQTKITLETDITPDIKAYIDSFGFTRVLNNITRNAIEAMNNQGILRIKLLSDTINGKSFGIISVSDTGVGIEPEHLKNIFVDLKTTKKSGLGLGLALSNRIIQHHGGSIQVESILKKGTTFSIFIPISSH